MTEEIKDIIEAEHEYNASQIQVLEGLDGFKEKHGIDGHVRICLFYIFFFELSQLAGIGYAGKNGKRFFQRFADGAFDVVVGRVGIAVAVQHVAETGDDAA